MNRINPSNENDNPNGILTFKPEVLAALRAFRHEKPWRGTVAERALKFQTLHTKLCEVCDCQWALNLAGVPDSELEHGNGGLHTDDQEIVLWGKLSVVTYLFCFGSVIFNGDRARALSWATGLYRRTFPRSAERMVYENGLVLKRNVGLN